MKALSRALSVLQILLLGGAAALHYLCQHRMGVARYIAYLNRKWQAALNLDIVFFSLVALFLLVACWQILRWRKRGQVFKLYTPWPLLLWLALATICFMLLYQGSGLRPYYQLLCLFNVILFSQLVKGLCLNSLWKSKANIIRYPLPRIP